MNRSEMVKLSRRPIVGLIPRGLHGRMFASGRVEWEVSKGDLVQAHRLHVQSARYSTFKGSAADATYALNDAATVRRMITRRKRINTLDILRGRA